MKKFLFVLPLLALLFFSNCDNSKKTAEAERTAAEEKEAVKLDSISTVLEQEQINLEADIQKLEESLQSIEK